MLTVAIYRYPGCQCDIPAHNYSFSFAPNPSWPNYYATSEQIHAYMKDVAEKYQVSQYIRLRHSVESAVWNEENGKWEIRVKNLNNGAVATDECDVFINASGILKYIYIYIYLIPIALWLMANTLPATGNGRRSRESKNSKGN